MKQNKTELTACPLRFSISLTIQMAANERVFVLARWGECSYGHVIEDSEDKI